ncbi:MAG: DUF115 domain-containing protein [Spirochaetia bacterium]|nr:DUF115 domain-containing protein [Spirochaetia bacterium]
MTDLKIQFPPSVSLFQEQMKMIQESNYANVSTKLKNINPDQLKNIQIVNTRSGYPTIFLNQIPLHSRHDPVQEAIRQNEKLQRFFDSKHILFFGAGIGYNLYLLLQTSRQNAAKIFWFEPDPEIIAVAFSLLDFRKFIKSGKLILITEIPLSDKMDLLFSGVRNKDIEFYVHRPAFTENSKYKVFYHQCENYLNKKDVNLATLSRFDRIWASNFVKNISHLQNARPIQDLFRRFTDIPVLICGAGPSLSDSLENIKKYQNKFILIAVDTSLKILNSFGIDPDITVTVDPQPVNREYIEGYRGNTLFVADPCCNYLTLRIIPENKLYFFGSPFALTEIIHPSLKEIPENIAFGGSVSTNAYDLALQMGANKIFLTGMDLSFTGGRAHARGAVLEEKLNFLECRTYRREIHNFRQLSALPPRTINNMNQSFSLTNDKLLIFHKWFEGRFHADGKKGIHIYNLTNEGAEISGSKQSSFSVFDNLEDLQRENLFLPIHKFSNTENCNKITLYDLLLKFKSELESFYSISENGRKSSEIIYKMLSNQNEDHNKMKENLAILDDIDRKILSNKDLSTILSGIIQKAISIVENEELKDESDLKKKDIMIAKKSLYLYSELSKAAGDYIRWIRRLLDSEKNAPAETLGNLQ